MGRSADREGRSESLELREMREPHSLAVCCDAPFRASAYRPAAGQWQVQTGLLPIE